MIGKSPKNYIESPRWKMKTILHVKQVQVLSCHHDLSLILKKLLPDQREYCVG